jgi:hypothetical protein
MMKRRSSPLTLGQKASVALRAWYWFVKVHAGLRRQPLPQLVRRLSIVARSRERRLPPERLGRGVGRVLQLGPKRVRCLISALVLFRLLREQGEPAELVIGMPGTPNSEEAHAWVEVARVDVGPPPGHRGHRELARYR